VGLVEPGAVAREGGWGGKGLAVVILRGGCLLGGRIRHSQKWRWGDRLGRGARLGLGRRLGRGSEEDVVEMGQGWGGERLIGMERS